VFFEGAVLRARPACRSRRHAQAGGSLEGREFGAAHAEAIFTMHGTLETGQRFHADIARRLAAAGRAEGT
jgi:alkanesulfonate monooxygenase SsuD/methylene tetrahydromethanopterin reductase-like flavin-dependent oxidoreductase (luciferase family)